MKQVYINHTPNDPFGRTKISNYVLWRQLSKYLEPQQAEHIRENCCHEQHDSQKAATGYYA